MSRRVSLLCFACLLPLLAVLCGACEREESGAMQLADSQAAKTALAPAPEAPPAPKRDDHGLRATLRAKDHLRPPGEASYPVQSANWNDPYPLRFDTLDTNYAFYKLNRNFYPQGLPRLNGRAVTLEGAIMPIDPPGDDGSLTRFWLANPKVVSAGCVFCNPPTLADLIFVQVKPGQEFKVDREELYHGIVRMTLTGRFFIAPSRANKLEYLFKLELR